MRNDRSAVDACQLWRQIRRSEIRYGARVSPCEIQRIRPDESNLRTELSVTSIHSSRVFAIGRAGVRNCNSHVIRQRQLAQHSLEKIVLAIASRDDPVDSLGNFNHVADAISLQD